MKEKKVVSVVEMMSRKYDLVFIDITSYEYECYQKIGKALQTYGTSIRDITAYARRICGKVAKVHLERRKALESISLHSKEGNAVFEVQDVLANVEERLIENETLNEKIALLAKCDSRKLAVLNAWANGITNELDISRMLAHSTGGSVEGHRSFIKRFKTRCQTKLAGIA